MSAIKIAGVMRAGAYSPNHIGNDAAIFNAVADHLRKRGCEVNVYSEDEFQRAEITEDVVLNMCRERESVAKLQSLEEQGKLVINSGFGIENCTRERMTRILMGSGIPYPESLMVNTDEAVVEAMEKANMDRAWIKRGDFHAMHKEDVSFVRHAQEAQEVLQEYFLRGIKRAVINRHLEGDLIKFYGVQGTDFFYWFYPSDVFHSKFGLEVINGVPKGLPFSVGHLKQISDEAARVLDVPVYGGDCVVQDDGQILIIDFNDWPSFAPCCQDAAYKIAELITNISQ